MDGNKIVLINDIRFKGKRKIVWEDVKTYLQRYVGKCYKIEEGAEIIYIGNDLPEEFTESESRKALMGTNANAATAIPELIQTAANPFLRKIERKNMKKKRRTDGLDMTYVLRYLHMKMKY